MKTVEFRLVVDRENLSDIVGRLNAFRATIEDVDKHKYGGGCVSPSKK